ncbi:MAG: hypothetical protein ACR2G3_11785 [Solirubrobacterales bacterium]
MAEHVAYYAFDRDGDVTCRHCEAQAKAGDWMEPYDELFDITCGKCEVMLYIVSYPTFDEVREWAARGHPAAIADLPDLDEREAFFARAHASQPSKAEELPEQEGERLDFTWDFLPDAGEDGDHVTVILLGGRELWREVAFWEGFDRFEQVKALLKERYGSRFGSLTPTAGSELYLLGDKRHTITTD